MVAHVRKASLLQENSRKGIATHIGKFNIPWADVEAVAADCQARGKFKDMPADLVATELKAIRTLARRLNEKYDTEA
jgi:hypothetical protein